jgi:Ca-activated chloride channel family protein
MRVFVFLLAAAFVTAPATGQEPAPISIRVDVGLVNVAFIVRDQNGALAANLTRDDFEVLEDGVPQEIRFFGRSADLPLRLALVLDVSPSQDKFNQKHLSDIEDFLEHAMTPRDKASLVRFGDQIRAIPDFTPSVANFMSALGDLKKQGNFIDPDHDDTRSGGTALFDALCATTRLKVFGEAAERKAIILFSDGEDNSSAHDLLDAIEYSQTADAPIYTVRYTEIHKGRLSARNKYGTREMDRLAQETGGAGFDASHDDVAKSLRQVADELRSTYDLGYVTTNAAGKGYRKLEIRVKRPGFTVRSKPGYYAR